MGEAKLKDRKRAEYIQIAAAVIMAQTELEDLTLSDGPQLEAEIAVDKAEALADELIKRGYLP